MDTINLDQLQRKFPQLTEENQRYILGMAEGLKHAQASHEKAPRKREPDKQNSGVKGIEQFMHDAGSE